LYYVLGAVLTAPIQDEAASPFAVQANAHFDVSDPRSPKNLLLHSAVEDWPYRGWVLAWHLVRLLSIALGAVTVWATFHLGRAILPDQPLIALTMAALTAFTPQFLFMSAVVNNDNAATAFSALILWRMAVLLRSQTRPQIWRHSALLGLLLGLGLLSKASVGALLPVVPLAIIIASLRARVSTRQDRGWLLAGALLLALGLAALISGWYFWRNWLLHGDPMGTSFLLQVNARREGPLTPEVLMWLFKGLFRSFWLGWIGISFEDGIYWLIGLACLLAHRPRLPGRRQRIRRLADRPLARPGRRHPAAGAPWTSPPAGRWACWACTPCSPSPPCCSGQRLSWVPTRAASFTPSCPPSCWYWPAVGPGGPRARAGPGSSADWPWASFAWRS